MRDRDLEELHGYFFEDLEEGMSSVYGKTCTDADILMFGGVSGDTNPLHLNEEFAEKTRFKGRIIHGMLTASVISTVIGTRMPGPGCIYVNQTLNFRRPVKPGDTVIVRVTLSKLVPEKRLAVFETVCTVRDKVVLDGEATTMVPTRADYEAYNEERRLAAVSG